MPELAKKIDRSEKKSMRRIKAKLPPLMLSLSKHERDGFSISPFDKLRANGHFNLYAFH
jgi:hypothetical protein